MKYLIVSDIHGSLPRLEKVIRFFHANGYDMMVILGDIANYGPRNGLPEGIDAMGVAESLNALADRIVAVRGNCDSEVDQMLLKFPCMSGYNILVAEGKRIFLTHGHKYNEEKRTPLGIDALFYGHTHLWKLGEKCGRNTRLQHRKHHIPEGWQCPHIRHNRRRPDGKCQRPRRKRPAI